MTILAGLLADYFNENKIFAVLKRQAYNYSIHSHIIHADAGWLRLVGLGFTDVAFSLHSGQCLSSLKLTFSSSLLRRELNIISAIIKLTY